MKLTHCLLTAGLLATIPLTTHATIVRRVEKTFTVQPGGTLKIETQGGDVRVKPGADDQVHVVAVEKIHASSEAEADELLQKLALNMTQAGNDVTATAKYEKRSGWLHFGSWPPVQVGFEVMVPAKFNANLRTSGGDIGVGDLAGTMELHTSGGDVSLGRIDGEVRAHTSGGDIHLAQASGAADLGTSGGDIIVGRVLGPVDAGTSGGDIRIDSVEGALKARTSGGNVSAHLRGKLQNDCSLGTSGGDIRVAVDAGVGFNLDAATSGGEVDAGGLTITIERGGVGKSRLAGTVNGGGPRLKLRTSGGNIVVKAN
jgi:hypothetical protein